MTISRGNVLPMTPMGFLGDITTYKNDPFTPFNNFYFSSHTNLSRHFI